MAKHLWLTDTFTAPLGRVGNKNSRLSGSNSPKSPDRCFAALDAHPTCLRLAGGVHDQPDARWVAIQGRIVELVIFKERPLCFTHRNGAAFVVLIG